MEACIPGAAPPPPHLFLKPSFFYDIKLLNKTVGTSTILTLTSRKKERIFAQTVEWWLLLWPL